MAYSHKPDPPASAGDHQMPAADSNPAETAPSGAPDEAGLTPEQLAKVVRRLEHGFYDRAEVREEIAQRVLDELDQ